MKLRVQNPALILVDIQKGFLDEDYWGGNRNNKNAEIICGIILRKWRELKLPIIHVRHSSTNPNSKLHKKSAGFDLVPIKAKKRIIKNVLSNSFGFGGTNASLLFGSSD